MIRYAIATLASVLVTAPAFAAPAIEVPAFADAETPTGVLGWSDKGWDSSFDAGITGSSGNTESFNIHLGLNAKHSDDKGADKIAISYDRNRGDTGVTKDQAVAEETHDFFFGKETNWAAFINVRYTHDNYAAWEHVASVFAGPSYRFLRGPEHTLTGRIGVGGSYKDNAAVFGKEDGTFTPEAMLGADYAWKINTRSSFDASVAVYPSLEDFLKECRVIASAAYSLAIDANKALKIGAEYTYNSDVVDPVLKGDVKYFVALSMKL